MPDSDAEARLRALGTLKGSMVVLEPMAASRFQTDDDFRESVLRVAEDYATFVGASVDVYGSGSTCFLLAMVEPRSPA